MNFKDEIQSFFGISLTLRQENKFEEYYKFLIEYNEITNLTRITEKNEVYYKHFFDSLSILKFFDINQIETICDMGSGAGFPSIPLKILFPHLKITIIDSLNKRIKFLEQLCQKLGLEQVSLNHQRIEDYSSIHQNKFDLVTARALGNMQLIIELGLPMTKINGYFVAYKSAGYLEELEKSKSAITKLGSVIEDTFEFDLPNDLGTRVLIKLKKLKHVMGYPRTFAQIKSKPLK